jgi:hypothetical protein
LGNPQIGGIDDNDHPWHEAATGKWQEAWLRKRPYVERRSRRGDNKYIFQKNLL